MTKQISKHKIVPVYTLRPAIQHYAWGDTTTIPSLLGMLSNEQEPWAELWLGTHPMGESKVSTFPLSGILGQYLPFLFKVIAVQNALSIQVHPNRQQAKEGFAREEAAGIDLWDPARSYKDENHKPELLLALNDFWALVSFRDLRAIQKDFEKLQFPSLLTQSRTLSAFFQNFLSLSSDHFDFPLLIRAIVQAQQQHMDRYWWVQELFSQYGNDRGVFAPLLLNLVHLKKGQAIYLEPCQLHAYLRGSGIEIMTACDNVLRLGCTKKHVDPQELLRITSCVSKEAHYVDAKIKGPLSVWHTPAKDFELMRMDICNESLAYCRSASAEILFCVEGKLHIKSALYSRSLVLQKGSALVVTAQEPTIRIHGKGVVYRAAVPSSMSILQSS